MNYNEPIFVILSFNNFLNCSRTPYIIWISDYLDIIFFYFKYSKNYNLPSTFYPTSKFNTLEIQFFFFINKNFFL